MASIFFVKFFFFIVFRSTSFTQTAGQNPKLKLLLGDKWILWSQIREFVYCSNNNAIMQFQYWTFYWNELWNCAWTGWTENQSICRRVQKFAINLGQSFLEISPILSITYDCFMCSINSPPSMSTIKITKWVIKWNILSSNKMKINRNVP